MDPGLWPLSKYFQLADKKHYKKINPLARFSVVKRGGLAQAQDRAAPLQIDPMLVEDRS